MKRSEFSFGLGIRDGCIILMSIIGISLMIVFLGGCGNTITGMGKDITDVGVKVTAWQYENPFAEKEVVEETLPLDLEEGAPK